MEVMNLKHSVDTLSDLALESSSGSCLKTTVGGSPKKTTDEGKLVDSEQAKIPENHLQKEPEPELKPEQEQQRQRQQQQVENKDDSNSKKRSSNLDLPPVTPRKKSRPSNPEEITSFFKNIHPREIDARIRMLFPRDKVVSKPCMSARIFACFTIYSEQHRSHGIDPIGTSISKFAPMKNDTPTRRAKRNNSSNIPILSFLQALVQVESSALGATPVQRKTVQFSAFDGSSTRPPRDSIMGSHVSRQMNINAMVYALKEIHSLLLLPHNHNMERHNAVLYSLQALRQFLMMLETNKKTYKNEYDYNNDNEKLRLECAKSMPFEWDPNRFKKAAGLYRQDVEKICNCLERQREVQEKAAPTQQTSLHEFNVMLYLETKLAESIGRTIRFHLRRIFNPIYGIVIIDESFEEEEEGSPSDDVFKRPSNMSQIIQMRHPEWYSPGSNSAVADGSVSSVLSLAVETIVNYFGFDTFFSEKEFVMPSIPDGFCKSAAAMRGIPRNSIGEPLPKEDLQAIIADTVEAQRFLAGAKACGFIRDLLHWPGVEEEVNRLGGWNIIEQCAKQFHSLRLGRLSPNDAHLAVFKNVRDFAIRVDKCWSQVKKATDECTQALDDLWIRFHCSATQTPKKSRKRRKLPPEVDIVRKILNEGLHHHMFPSIFEPEEAVEWIQMQNSDYTEDVDDEDEDNEVDNNDVS